MRSGEPARNPGRRHNPLRRSSDRVEEAVTVALVLALLLLSPWVARQTADATYRDVIRANAWEREHRHRVEAVLSRGASHDAAGDERDDDVTTAVARWTAPDGTSHTGIVHVGADRRAGDTVPLWIDDRGRVTGPPNHRDPVAVAAVSAALSVLAVAAGLAGVRRIVRWRLDRGRLRAWQAEWAAVEPDWSRRR